jgi:hypothetical protein
MSVNKHVFVTFAFFLFADYPGFRLSGKIYFPTNPDNRESIVEVLPLTLLC